VFLPILNKEGGPSLLIGLHFFGTTGVFDLPEPIMAKLVCHSLLQHLPDEAMPEAVESLLLMREFYSVPRVEPKQVLPAPPIPARWGETRTAQVVPVTEDE